MFATIRRAFRLELISPLAAGLLFIAAQAAWASDISFVDAGWNIGYQQTGNGSTLTGSGDFFSADLNTTVSDPYTSATLTYPGSGSPQSLSLNTPTDYGYQSGGFSGLSSLNAAYPFGTYTFSGSNGDSTGFDYTATDYSTTPYLTGTDYTSLQGMNASQGFTFNLSTDTPGTAPGAATGSSSFIFFDIYDVTTGYTAAFSNSYSPTTTSIFLPGGTLTPGDEYEYYIDYSDRYTLASPGAEFDATLGFDTRTEGFFTPSAVPEPGSYAILLVAGFVGLLILRRAGVPSNN